MEFSAIYHNADKKQCFCLEKGRFLIRIKTKKDDLVKVVFHYQDKYIPVERIDTRAQKEMIKACSDQFCDYYEAEVEMDVVCLRYFFELQDHTGEVKFYSNHDFYDVVVTDTDYMYNCTQNLREEEIFDVPEWAKNKVVYQIFPSRYATSKEVEATTWYQTPIGPATDLKGDLRGIINHLDHLQELGIDIIYMTPIFESPSTHKYNTVDYYRIDSSFGTEADLKELVEKAHAMGMKVILDGVFNHTSRDFFAFKDILEKGEKSAYCDWYHIQEFPPKMEPGQKPNYKCFGYYGYMPKTNLQNPETAEYFINVARYWVEKCDIDGWRLDVSDEISHKFWRKFRSALKEVKKDLLIIGEIWYHAEDFLDGDEWDTVMNYPFYFGMDDLFTKNRIRPSDFLGKMGYLEGNLHKDVIPVLWNLLDSHDTPRFIYRCGENVDKFKAAVALQLLWPGMPFVYYGDEYGLTGAQDPDCRRGMLWDKERQNKEVYAWYRKLIELRKKYPCITTGRTINTQAQDEKNLIYVEKELDGYTMLMMFHVGGKACSVEELVGAEYIGKENLLTGVSFDGKLREYDTVVLMK
ncbi:MAG: alpha-glycosidase [Lachnospiraceae bacterium]|nr:alpha-glycosidase [Lachnospiraceae bacterium]